MVTRQVLVLLLTRDLLTRPWCMPPEIERRSESACVLSRQARFRFAEGAGLLEINEAMMMAKPIVLFEIKGR